MRILDTVAEYEPPSNLNFQSDGTEGEVSSFGSRSLRNKRDCSIESHMSDYCIL